MKQHASPRPLRLSVPPRLDLRGPVRLGMLAVLLAAGVAAAAAATIPLGARLVLAELRLEETQKLAVRHAKGGIVNQIHVKPGDTVNAGDLLVSLETRDLDEQIAALKLQAQAATLKLSGIRREAQLVDSAAEVQPNAAARKAELYRRLADVEKETIGLQVRIAHAEQDVVRAEIRAPLAGRILDVATIAPGSIIAEASTIAELLPATGQVILSGRAIDANRNDLIPGRSARVSLVSPISHRVETFDARILESPPGSAADASLEKIRIEIRTTFDAFKARVGMGEHLVGELRLGRVDGRSARTAAATDPSTSGPTNISDSRS